MRERLNRGQVVDAAVILADRHGIESLTMRNLSQDLGVVPMAIYKHVAHKEELLDLMVDVVVEEIELDTNLGWKAALRERALSMRAALVRHPWAIGLMESGTWRPTRLRHHEMVMACLRDDAALSFPMALHALSLLDGLVYGFALQQRAFMAEGASDGSTLMQAVEHQPLVPAEQYPYVTELLKELHKSGYDYSEEFAFGVDLVLSGIERLRKTQAGRTPGKPKAGRTPR